MLTNEQQTAYRYLLYWAMLDTRNKCQHRCKESWNPLEWRRQYQQSRAAGAVADWLHDLALYAGNNLSGFDEQWFWREYEAMRKRFAGLDFAHYREAYERRLGELSNGKK
jgi:hypothetical protein